MDPSSSNSTCKGSVVQRVVVVPGDHYVYHWKVKTGTPVRIGETIALAAQQNSSLPITLIIGKKCSQPPQHKRPQKRKRGTAQKKAVRALPQKESYNDNDFATTSPYSSVTPTVPILAPADGVLRIGGDGLVIGSVEECSHPAIMMGGLCVMCGTKIDPTAASSQQQQTLQLPAGSVPSQQRVTVSGGITMTISEQEAQDMGRQTSKRLLDQSKLSLVLDLDHTLVHATADPQASVYCGSSGRNDIRTLLLPLTESAPPTGCAKRLPSSQVVFIKHFVKLRPYLKEFLASVSERYELSVYTAGTRLYAEQITMVLCRHMINAHLDQEDLDRLRYELFLEKQYVNKDQQANFQNNNKNNDTTEQTHHGSEEGDNPQMDRIESNEMLKGKTKDDNKKVFKKNVSFGEPLVSLKTDEIKSPLKKVEILESKLEEAERLEGKAVELRQRLFGSRIVSRTDVGDLGRDVKSLKRIFPCGGTMSAIVDDREDVWANASDNTTGRVGEPPENLLLVRPYHYKPFLGFTDVNNAAGTVDVAGGEEMSEKEDDLQLLWTGDILQRLHTRFYANDLTEQQQKRRTVPLVLHDMRKNVLSDARLVLSGLIPLRKQQRDDQISGALRPSIVRYAENLGAEILDHVASDLTHVVAARDGTDKINRARRIPGCAVVKASWLMECMWSVTKRDDTSHFLGAVPSKRVLQSPNKDAKDQVSKTQQASRDEVNIMDGSISSSDESDVLVAELEQQMS